MKKEGFTQEKYHETTTFIDLVIVINFCIFSTGVR